MLKDTYLKALSGDKQFYCLNQELNDEILYQFIFDNIIKNITLEDMKQLVSITPVPCTHRKVTAAFNIKFIGDFSLNTRMNILEDDLNFSSLK